MSDLAGEGEQGPRSKAKHHMWMCSRHWLLRRSDVPCQAPVSYQSYQKFPHFGDPWCIDGIPGQELLHCSAGARRRATGRESAGSGHVRLCQGYKGTQSDKEMSVNVGEWKENGEIITQTVQKWLKGTDTRIPRVTYHPMVLPHRRKGDHQRHVTLPSSATVGMAWGPMMWRSVNWFLD